MNTSTFSESVLDHLSTIDSTSIDISYQSAIPPYMFLATVLDMNSVQEPKEDQFVPTFSTYLLNTATELATAKKVCSIILTPFMFVGALSELVESLIQAKAFASVHTDLVSSLYDDEVFCAARGLANSIDDANSVDYLNQMICISIMSIREELTYIKSQLHDDDFKKRPYFKLIVNLYTEVSKKVNYIDSADYALNLLSGYSINFFSGYSSANHTVQ